MTVKDKTKWVIKLPKKAKLVVKVGDNVEVSQKLAEYKSYLVEVFDFSSFGISEERKDELNQVFKDKEVEQGTLFYKKGFLKGKVCFPMTGVCLGLDEFMNLRVEKLEEEVKEILSPVEGKVAKLEEGKLSIEFKAKEYLGKGLNGLKGWGEGEVKVINEARNLDHELEGNILFTENGDDRSFLLKARVIGVKGVVIKGDGVKEKDVVDIDLPILKIDEENWEKFMKSNLKKEKRILVNAKMDKMLVVE